MKSGDLIEFNQSKHFKFLRLLGQGGTGDTVLFKDETTNMFFAIKKYSPKNKEYKDEFYERFVDEIKILFQIAHPNIVRIYNYYLYPEYKAGYLQMEYIEGVSVDKYEPSWGDSEWEKIFIDVISAFNYLEKKRILHRDIRPANIMINDNDDVKIIDFGFGKELKEDEEENSILLNWPATEFPQEVAMEGNYNHQSEIFFIGKLFQKIFREKQLNFKFDYIIDKMIKINPDYRYKTFEEVSQGISEDVLGELGFTEDQKKIYRNFAQCLCDSIIDYKEEFKPIDDINEIFSKLGKLIRSSSLEEYIQDIRKLIQCFIINGYTYTDRKAIEISCVKEFYKFISGLDEKKQKVVMDNINTRLSGITIDILNDEQMPF